MLEGKSSAQMVKDGIPLSQYVRSFLTAPLKPQGIGKYRTACFIHGGDNPTALTIDDAQGLWYCYTGDCGGGSIIDMWMRQNNSSDFGAAVEALAKEADIRLPERIVHKSSVTAITRALQLVAEHAQDYLLEGKTEDARAARRYLQERKIRKSVARDWGLGMIPPGSSAVQFILDSGADERALIDGDMLHKSESTGARLVKMNGRLLFPILDKGQRTVAFGARIVPGVGHSFDGKYINTSETPAYSKSSVMYCMDLITDQTKHAIIVEGYLDAMGVNLAIGDDTTVALAACGTAVTPGHMEILSSMDRVTDLFDGDIAGLKANVKSVWMANSLGDKVDAVHLDGGADPWDLYLNDPGALDILLDPGTPLLTAAVSAQWEVVQHDHAGISDWVRNVVPTLAYSSHRDEVVSAAARLLGQSPTIYKRQLALPVDIGSRRGMDPMEFQSSVTPSTRELCAAIIGMHQEDRDGVLASFRPWTSRVESAIRNWLPITTDMDLKILKRMTLGLEGPDDPKVDQAVASLMAGMSTPNIAVILRGIAKQLLGVISQIDKEEEYLLLQVKQLRKVLDAARSIEMQPAVLAYLMETALDVDRALGMSASGSAASGVA